jgi:hypothetical protein
LQNEKNECFNGYFRDERLDLGERQVEQKQK